MKYRKPHHLYRNFVNKHHPTGVWRPKYDKHPWRWAHHLDLHRTYLATNQNKEMLQDPIPPALLSKLQAWMLQGCWICLILQFYASKIPCQLRLVVGSTSFLQRCIYMFDTSQVVFFQDFWIMMPGVLSKELDPQHIRRNTKRAAFSFWQKSVECSGKPKKNGPTFPHVHVLTWWTMGFNYVPAAVGSQGSGTSLPSLKPTWSLKKWCLADYSQVKNGLCSRAMCYSFRRVNFQAFSFEKMRVSRSDTKNGKT